MRSGTGGCKVDRHEISWELLETGEWKWQATSTRSGVKEDLDCLQLGSGGFEAAPSRCVDFCSRGGSGGRMRSAVASHRITGGLIQVWDYPGLHSSYTRLILTVISRLQRIDKF